MLTCSHKNYKSNNYITYAISGNKGKDVNYEGKCYPKLAPKKSFWKKWHDNIGKISDEENNKYYIEQFYIEVLSKLDVEEVYNELKHGILLCYEDNDEFCHRHIVASWIELLLGIEVPEVKIEGLNIEIVERPTWIKDYLEEIMKKNLNMHKFTSLHAFHVFEESEKIEQKAYCLEEKTGKYYGNLHQQACYMRCEADHIEEEYRYNNFVKKLNKTK